MQTHTYSVPELEAEAALKFAQAAPVTRTVSQFCEKNQISKVHFYELVKRGLGPRIMKAGRRTLISLQAESDWHRQMEAASEGRT